MLNGKIENNSQDAFVAGRYCDKYQRLDTEEIKKRFRLLVVFSTIAYK